MSLLLAEVSTFDSHLAFPRGLRSLMMGILAEI